MPPSNWPSKDLATYKKMRKALEKKNFKLGLKYSRTLLSNSKYSNDADTLAIKAMLLHGLERYDEAFECVNKGLKQDIKNLGCWQAFGHLYRAKRNLEDALKCFRNAFKIDSKNADTLRNLFLIQIQMRDLDGFRETCYLNLQSHPLQRVSYISYLVACHLSKKYDMALNVLRVFMSLTQSLEEWELSELYLYESCLLRESGNFNGALEQLLSKRSDINDRIALDESLGQLYLSLDKFEEAKEPIMRLIERMPDNKMYYEWLFSAHQVSNDDEKAELMLKFADIPRNETPRLLRFKYLKGDKLEIELKEHLKRGLTKGIPSLFASLRFLYTNHDRVELLERILKGFVSSLESTGAFNGDKINKEQLKESATALVWTYFFLGQHYDCIRDPATALKYIDSAIEHTPTLPDMYLLKARVFKHAGDNLEACRWAEEAMNLDMADRYLNSKCVKYMLRAGLIEEARTIISKMVADTRKTEDYLKEMQCMWYEMELAHAFDSQEQWKEALKICFDIERHFDDFSFDQIDYHSFCYRKLALRAYIQYLKTMDNQRNCRFYRRAAMCALKIALREHDRPENYGNRDASALPHQLSAAELKKQKSKQRKAELKAVKQLSCTGQDETSQHIDTQPDLPPLELTNPFLHGLLNYNSDFLDSYIIAFEVYKRFDKRILMLQTVVRAYKLAGLDHPKVHAILADFCSICTANDCCKPVEEVIQRVLNTIVKLEDPVELNENFLKRNETDYTCRLCYAKTLLLLSKRFSSSIPENWKILAVRQIKQLDDATTGVTLDSCSEAYSELKNGEYGASNEDIESFRVECAKKFPYAVAFRSDWSANERLEAYRLERLKV